MQQTEEFNILLAAWIEGESSTFRHKASKKVPLWDMLAESCDISKLKDGEPTVEWVLCAGDQVLRIGGILAAFVWRGWPKISVWYWHLAQGGARLHAEKMISTAKTNALDAAKRSLSGL